MKKNRGALRMNDNLLVLKHVGYEIKNVSELENLLAHLRETTSQIEGILFKDIYFTNDKKEFILFLECRSEETYHEWRKICPPPPGAEDWHEILLTRSQFFSTKFI